jgi:hypothetical protein
MSAEELAHVRHRLASIGHSQKNVDEYLGARAKPEEWGSASATEMTFADSEFAGITFNSDDSEYWSEWENPLEDVMAMVQKVASAIPPPIINVYITPERDVNPSGHHDNAA